jgi:hypothetical protein
MGKEMGKDFDKDLFELMGKEMGKDFIRQRSKITSPSRFSFQ